MRKINCFLLFFLAAALAGAQDRGSIPEELLRPKRGEAPRYPIDTVIGELGQGSASNAAYSFANSIVSGLMSGQAGEQGRLEEFLPPLESIAPTGYRLGGGREEPDGAISFLVRFIGREYGITGELFVRYVTRTTEEKITKEVENEEGETETVEEVLTKSSGSWTLDDLILEEAKSREEEKRESLQRFDFSPYERFF